MLSKSSLEVSLESPPEPMQDRILVKGLPEEFAVKDLKKFMKKMFQQDVKEILFCGEESEEMALVCFDEDIGKVLLLFKL